jgi:hypothetical protein
MSLNKTLDRLFDEIRREAKRNPDFADRLDAVMRAHASRRDVPEAVQAEIAGEAAPAPQPAPPQPKPKRGKSAPNINPAGLYKREGAEALAAALSLQDLGSLRALVAEHNLDPSGVTGALTRDELASHILLQAKRRAERDDKMFDY